MEGKRVVVVGAGSIGPGWGNGKAAAALYAREGARVLCVDRDAAAADETAAIIKNEGGEAAAFAADVTTAGAAESVVDAGIQHFGGIDTLHYNVGVSEPGGVDGADLEAWRRVFAINVDGAMLMARAALRPMLAARAGSFVFISSIAAIRAGGYAYASYEASKAALNRLSQTIAVAHAADGIRSNIIMPGLMDTPHVQHMIKGRTTPAEGMAERRAAAPPMRRQGDAWDVARAALFLASDEAGYITGVALPVDGGLTLTVPSA
ncbi:MAG: SDR family NAD(P)-dependent oxidoreductase [Pseudomonadota bacterium]